MSASEGIFLASGILVCPPDVSLVVPTPLTYPSLLTQTCSCLLLNSFLMAVMPPSLPAYPLPGPQGRCGCGCFSVVFRGSVLYYCPIPGTEHKPGSWAELQSQRHLAVLPHSRPPFDLLQCTRIKHVCLDSPLREQTES